jgi:hypothetical protein
VEWLFLQLSTRFRDWAISYEQDVIRRCDSWGEISDAELRFFSCLLATLMLSASVATADIFEWEWLVPNDPSFGREESTTLVPDGAGVVAEPGLRYWG